MISGNLRIWGFLRWKQRFFELDSAELRLCARALPSSLVPLRACVSCALRVLRARGARVALACLRAPSRRGRSADRRT
eukprot:COSAG06_NODE_40729_length_399_cov_0.846667_1_plen_77_part_01